MINPLCIEAVSRRRLEKGCYFHAASGLTKYSHVVGIAAKALYVFLDPPQSLVMKPCFAVWGGITLIGGFLLLSWQLRKERGKE